MGGNGSFIFHEIPEPSNSCYIHSIVLIESPRIVSDLLYAPLVSNIRSPSVLWLGLCLCSFNVHYTPCPEKIVYNIVCVTLTNLKVFS